MAIFYGFLLNMYRQSSFVFNIKQIRQVLFDKQICDYLNQYIAHKGTGNNIYDLMPHTQISECLALYKVNRTLRTLLKKSVGLWKTMLEGMSRPITQVTIKCGIYQGDIPAAVLHRPQPPQSDNHKKWVQIQVQKWSYNQPPPLHV